jgi:hypothetical protein
MAIPPDPPGRSASVLLNREFTLAVMQHAAAPLRATRAVPQQVVVAAGSVSAALPVVRSGRLHFTFWVEDADRLIAVSFGPGETALLSSLFDAASSEPAALAQWVKTEIANWEPIVKSTGFTPED